MPRTLTAGIPVVQSGDKKTGPVAMTWRPVGATDAGTCPPTCRHLIEKTCYAMFGHVRPIQRRAAGMTFDLLRFMLELPRGAFLRHLGSGDFFTAGRPDATYIDPMFAGHTRRADITGWTYTHGWPWFLATVMNRLPNLCVNASTESLVDTLAALAAGWPVARSVTEDTPAIVEYDTFTQRVCPAQTHGVTCDHCLLCARPARKLRGKPLVIAFRPEGGAPVRTDRMLRMVGD
jgi:hypothetical protein